MPTHVDTRVAGEPLLLLGDRAVYWPARRRLLIADLHLGKGDVFRRAGIPVPRGGTSHDLARLDVLIERHQAAELVVLGDMLHGPTPDVPWKQTWLAWRHRHRALRITVIAGNHDRRLAQAGLEVELPGECIADAPFLLRHEPEADAALHVICGHLHPAFPLPGIRQALPGFWLRERMLVLPPFSAFTGGQRIALSPGESAALCVEGTVVLVNAAR